MSFREWALNNTRKLEQALGSGEIIQQSSSTSGPMTIDQFIRALDQAGSDSVTASNALDSVVWIFAAVDAIATNCSLPEMKITIDGVEVPEENEVRKLLERPHPEFMWEDAIYITAAQLVLLGKSAWILDPFEPQSSGISLPKSIHFDDPRSLVRKELYWEWTPSNMSGKKIKLPLHSVLMMRKPHPYRPWDVMCKDGPLGQTIQGIVHSERFNNEFFKRGGKLAGVIQSSGNLSRKQRMEITDRVKDNHQGPGKSFNYMVMDGGLTFNATQATHKDMDFIELERVARDKCLAAFRVPPVQISIMDTSHYANAEQQNESFWMENLVPLLKGIASWINHGLLIAHGRRERFSFNYRSIPALQKKLDPLAGMMATMFDRGLTLNIINDSLNMGMDLEPIGELADQSFITTAVTPAQFALTKPLPPAPSPSTPENNNEDEDEEGDMEQEQAFHPEDMKIPAILRLRAGDDFEQKTQIWQKNLEGSQKIQKRMEAKYSRIIASMRKNVLKAFDEYAAQVTPKQSLDMDDAIKLKARELQLGMPPLDLEHEAGWADMIIQGVEADITARVLAKYGVTQSQLNQWYEDIWNQSVKEGVKAVRSNAGFGSSNIPAGAMSFIATKRIQLSERLGAPREAVRQAISDGLKANAAGSSTIVQTMESVREAIKHQMNNTASRARTITRTETGQAVQSAKNAWMYENDVTHMQWVSARVKETRDSHALEDGNIVKLGEAFPITGLQYPKEAGGPAEEVINCLCDAVPLSPAESRKFEEGRA